jgi:hypothetical protein
MDYHRFLFICSLCSISLTAIAVDVPYFKPGEWEISTVVKMGGKDALTIPARSSGCIDPTANIRRDFSNMEKEGCKISLESKSDIKYKYAVSCESRDNGSKLENTLPLSLEIVINASGAESFTETINSTKSKSVINGRLADECRNGVRSSVDPR